MSKIVSGKTVTEESVANKVRLHVCEQQASNGGKKGKGVRKGAEKSVKGSDKVEDGAEEKNKKGKKLVRKRKCEVETNERNKRMRSEVEFDSERPGPSAIYVDSEFDSDNEAEITADELCCACKKFRPDKLKNGYVLEFTKWVQCTRCIWVHLGICTEVRVVHQR